MENKTFSEINLQEQIASSVTTAISVITNPIGFFRTMPKTGGLIEPLIFLALIGGVGGILQATFIDLRCGPCGIIFDGIGFYHLCPDRNCFFWFRFRGHLIRYLEIAGFPGTV